MQCNAYTYQKNPRERLTRALPAMQNCTRKMLAEIIVAHARAAVATIVCAFGRALYEYKSENSATAGSVALLGALAGERKRGGMFFSRERERACRFG